jgi:hypothetical protein
MAPIREVGLGVGVRVARPQRFFRSGLRFPPPPAKPTHARKTSTPALQEKNRSPVGVGIIGINHLRHAPMRRRDLVKYWNDWNAASQLLYHPVYITVWHRHFEFARMEADDCLNIDVKVLHNLITAYLILKVILKELGLDCRSEGGDELGLPIMRPTAQAPAACDTHDIPFPSVLVLGSGTPAREVSQGEYECMLRPPALIARLARPALRNAALVATTALMAGAAVPSLAADPTPEEAKQIGVDAYIYGYSLMTSDVTEKAFINTVAPDPGTLQARIRGKRAGVG